MTVQHNAYVISARMAARGPAVEAALSTELAVQAQLIVRRMRVEAPKFQSILTNRIAAEKIGPLEQRIAPLTDYAENVIRGISPGGKGLPRWESPKARDIIEWLRRRAPSSFVGPQGLYNKRAPKMGSKRAIAEERQLRDRYEGMAWHIRHYGVQADPFVERTHSAMAADVVSALKAAAARALNPDGGAWSAS